METFAHRLTHLRESKDLKKKDLAAILNVSAACVSQYEKGHSMPGYDILCRLSEYFNVSIDFLLGNEEGIFKFQLSDVFVDDLTYLSLLDQCNRVPAKNRSALLSVIKALQETSQE